VQALFAVLVTATSPRRTVVSPPGCAVIVTATSCVPHADFPPPADPPGLCAGAADVVPEAVGVPAGVVAPVLAGADPAVSPPDEPQAARAVSRTRPGTTVVRARMGFLSFWSLSIDEAQPARFRWRRCGA
jgi:hypothetical protein